VSWQTQLRGDSVSWLLESDSPNVRYLALRELFDLPPMTKKLKAACKEDGGDYLTDSFEADKWVLTTSSVQTTLWPASALTARMAACPRGIR